MMILVQPLMTEDGHALLEVVVRMSESDILTLSADEVKALSDANNQGNPADLFRSIATIAERLAKEKQGGTQAH